MEDVLKPLVACYQPFEGVDFGVILTLCFLEKVFNIVLVFCILLLVI